MLITVLNVLFFLLELQCTTIPLLHVPYRNVVLALVEHVAHLRIGEETVRLGTHKIC